VVAHFEPLRPLSKLPISARRVLVQYKQLRSSACQVVTTGQARALVQAFVKAGIPPSQNSAETIAFDLVGAERPYASYLHLHPALPHDRC